MSDIVHISTIDVKGKIDPMGGEFSKGTLANSEGNFESAVVRFSSFEIVIAPTTKSFNELYIECKERIEMFGGFFVVDMGKNHLLYKEQRGFTGKKKETFSMLLMVEGKTKSYLLEGKGIMLNPIVQLEDAQKALAVAKTFEPAD